LKFKQKTGKLVYRFFAQNLKVGRKIIQSFYRPGSFEKFKKNQITFLKKVSEFFGRILKLELK